jgi:hypothetical protein
VPTFVDRGVSRGQRGGFPTVVNLRETLPNANKYNKSIQFFIIYVPSQQLQCQLQTQLSADINNNNNNNNNNNQLQ